MAAKNVGAIPAPGDADRRRPRAAGDGAGRVRDASATCSARTGRRPRSARRCGSSARRTSTCPTRRRGSSRRRPGAACDTVLHVALQAVSDCNTLLSPFLPHCAQTVHELLGGTGDVVAACREIRRGHRPRRRSALPGHHRRLRRAHAGVGVACRRARHAAARRRRPSSPSSTPRSSRRSWRRLEGERGDAERPRCATGWPPRRPEPLPLPVVDSHSHLDIARRGDGASTRRATRCAARRRGRA